jgi:Flp pilus assembly protein TadG
VPRRHAAAGGSARQRDRGSTAVEFVIVAPLLLVLLMFMVYVGRVVEVHTEVDGAARDAARAASVATSQGNARAAAIEAVGQDLPDCASSSDVTGWSAAGSQPVSVAITCPLNMSILGFGFGHLTVSGTAVAPMDPFVARR